MFEKVIRLPSKTEMHYHYFCNKCHYYFFRESIGSNFCPNCGVPLKWHSSKQNNNFNYFAQLSEDMYKEIASNV